MTVLMRGRDGWTQPLAVAAWTASATPAERTLLASLRGPVLDLGCGPGRLVVALGELGIPALGVDASAHAVDQARARGATALRHSVFDALPGEGRWHSVLLLDGNVGIGGAPVDLLRRVARLLSGDGRAVVEAAPPGAGSWTGEARLERDDEISGWFPWARVAADDLARVAAAAGLRLAGWHVTAGRWFARLGRVVA
ncbi:class I SAM-dependent methyltransferase [Jiangella sp. DSM 45060]|uniref:methyltransferase domain-containing protein n=1 Tax=Jiangella sp. DSM 45060 TaxID=1798224 RepID=UPI0008798CAE|nr:class I SAM-dependent methyltransferase [Jiangella sp. DSM 45060]SDT14793.1 Methyltransferase domain-containing protein [Jiangella sp. DSM 45060]